MAVGLTERDFTVGTIRVAIEFLFRLNPFELLTEVVAFGLELTLKPLNPVMLTIRITGPNLFPLAALATETGVATGPTVGRVREGLAPPGPMGKPVTGLTAKPPPIPPPVTTPLPGLEVFVVPPPGLELFVGVPFATGKPVRGLI